MSLYNRVGRGTYWRALNLARCLVQFGHSVTLVAMSDDRLFRFRVRVDEGVKIIESPDLLPGMLRSGWDLWDVLRRITKLQNLNFDLVHAFECRPVAIYPALYIHKNSNIPHLTDWGDWFGRGGSVEERKNPLLRFVLRPIETYYEQKFRTQAQGTTVINSVLREKAVQLGISPESILLLRNGSDGKRIRPVLQTQARLQMDLPLDVPIIGYIGSIFHRDAELMADAFLKILWVHSSALLLVAGYFDADIEGMTGKPDSIIRTGPVSFDQIGLILSTCDICWLPLSDSGANRGRWPIKLNDYMAAGRPVVTTAVGDLGNFITQHVFGMASPATPHDLSDCVLGLLADPVTSNTMGMRARELAETTYAWETISKKLEGFYTKIVADGA